MYTLCNRRLQRSLSSLERKIKENARRVVGEMTKNIIRMLRGERVKIKR
jgi:hypothetical protein